MVRWVVVGFAISLVGCNDGAEPPADGAGGTAGAGAGAPGGAGSGGAAGSNISGTSGAGTSGATNGGGTGGRATEGCSPPITNPSADPSAVLLAGGDNMQPFSSVQALGDHVFYVSGGGIERVPKAGGTVERLLADSERPRIRVGPDGVYWIRDGALLSLPSDATDGTPPTTMAADIGADVPNDNLLFVDATHAYFWLRASGTIQRLDLSTAETAPIVSGTSNIAWYVHDGSLYFADDYDTIHRVPLSGGTPEELRRLSSSVWTLAADETGVFYGSYGFIAVVAPSTSTTLLNLPQDYIERLAIRGERLLFSSRDSKMGWVLKDGSACTILTGAAGDFDSWSHDADYVFLAQGGRLYRIAP